MTIVQCRDKKLSQIAIDKTNDLHAGLSRKKNSQNIINQDEMVSFTCIILCADLFTCVFNFLSLTTLRNFFFHNPPW